MVAGLGREYLCGEDGGTVMVGVEVTRRETSEEAKGPASTDTLLGGGPRCTCWFVKE